MGWLILGVVLCIIGVWRIVVRDGIGSIVVVIGFSMFLFSIFSIVDAQTDVYFDYQTQYEEYVSICKEIENCEGTNIFEDEELMAKIRNYNSEIYNAKNEGFMTKFTHNQRFKELEYIEIDGLAIDVNKDNFYRKMY